MPVVSATTHDIPDLITLINSAYRGAESRLGWTTEANLLAGEIRTDEADILKLMQAPDAVFLKFVNERGETAGTVYLRKVEGKLYLGMLSVSPRLQAKGIGKELMASAES